MEDPGAEQPYEENRNDLSPQLLGEQTGSSEYRDSEVGQVLKAKRCSACTLCRRRKLKCDGGRPACSTCSRLHHVCSYDEVRKKSGPKRGYVKHLEARLAQVETLLKTSGDLPAAVAETNNVQSGQSASALVNPASMLQSDILQPVPQLYDTLASNRPGDDNATTEETYPWEMISLGLDEPLPIQPVVDELNQIYFDKSHPSHPIIHRSRYYAAMHLAPHTRPPICLRYAMWCNAACMTDKYNELQEHFYHRARKYVQQDEMKGHGESMLTVAHCQTWVLLATYEFKKMSFPRAWMSSGRASRMALMMGLNRVDISGLQVKQCLPPARDWTEQEERRRTFWSAFCVDRYASIGTGWPTSIEEQDIQTRMPGSDESFDLSRPEHNAFLSDALSPTGVASLSSFAGVALLAALFGRNLTHLHRPGPDDNDHDLNGEFWKRHRDIDSILLNISLGLPDHLRLPSCLNDPNAVFLNMNIHASTICLHQAAIFKTDISKGRIPARVSAESKVRCITAAAETASIMRTICHLDLSTVNPFMSFCLYVAARVFVQYLRSRPSDHQVGSSLRFLLSAMHAIKRRNPLTDSFLAQLDVDLESAGLESLRVHPKIVPKPDENSKLCGAGGLLQNRVDAQDNSAANFEATMPYMDGGVEFTANQTALPSRQRVSPTFVSAMDTSPEGSGDHLYAGSSSHNIGSSRTTSTTYSPKQQGQLQGDSERLAAVFNSSFPAMNMGTDFVGVQQPGGAFISTHGWNDGVHGLSGSTAQGDGYDNFSSGEVVDVMAGMSDAEWTTVLESMGGWDSGLDQISMNPL